jgi:signal peptidase II
VTDFIVWHIKDHEWPAFNIADAALCIGVALMVIDMLKPRPAAAASS